MVTKSKYCVTDFNTFETFNDVSDTLQNFSFIEARVLGTAGTPDKRCGYQEAW